MLGDRQTANEAGAETTGRRDGRGGRNPGLDTTKPPVRRSNRGFSAAGGTVRPLLTEIAASGTIRCRLKLLPAAPPAAYRDRGQQHRPLPTEVATGGTVRPLLTEIATGGHHLLPAVMAALSAAD
ncbi:hypothetical protein ACFPN7_04650 [Amycolatopsis halotolerans]|uniref:hypothetical protein n=1 Tax=Amycolatopsis halotolerans TaxID=330083 RepID=UPI003615F77F